MTHPLPRLDTADIKQALKYIDKHWSRLERTNKKDAGTLIGLPHSYFVPTEEGSEEFPQEESYYFDTYFIALSLLGTKRHKQASDLADNLITLIKRFGMVPASNRFYSTSRSQAPLLTSLLLEIYDAGASKEWLAPRVEVAKQEYHTVWMGAKHPHHRQVFKALSRYYDANVSHELAEAESGWSNTTRFRYKCLDYIPIDLNALLYKYEVDFARAALIVGKPKEAEQWRSKARERKTMVDKYLWNEQAGFYFDYNYQIGKQGRTWSLAALYALWSGMASEEQAAKVAKNLQRFEMAGGLVATLEHPRVAEKTPSQWSYPNGWAPLHLLAVRGLTKYGYVTDAVRVARRWLATNVHDFKKYGTFFDKYNVVDADKPPKAGNYVRQTGFSCTNAVFSCIAKDYLQMPEGITTAPHVHKIPIKVS